MPLFGPPNVEKLKAKADVKGLTKALRYKKDFEVPGRAARALGEIGDARAVPPLIAALNDEHMSLRWDAADALGKIGDARAVEPLIAAFKDGQVPNIKALEHISGPRAVEPLSAALEDERHEVRHAAAKALGKLRDTRGVEPLMAALNRSPDLPTIEALGMIGDARAVEPIIATLRIKFNGMRKAAVSALRSIGDRRAVEPLIAALKDESKAVREAAAFALEVIGDPRAVEALIATLQDENKAVRWAAVRALDKLGWQPDRSEKAAAYWIAKLEWDRCIEMGAPAVEPLISALSHAESDLREAAAVALGKIADLRAVAPLIDALNDNPWQVRRAAADALVELYRSGDLDEQSKQRIVALRRKMTKPHRDTPASCEFRHKDTGIGVTF
jgi:HEAT repeat protein